MCRTVRFWVRWTILSLVLILMLAIAAGTAAAAGEPTDEGAPARPYSPRSGPPLGLPGGERSVTWSQPPDLYGTKLSSEVFSYDWSSEVADDLMMTTGENFAIDFWGGYFYWNPGDPAVTSFTIRGYADAGCVPGQLLVTTDVFDVATTFVGYDGWGWPTYKYHVDHVWLPLPHGQRCWISFQAREHPVPPYWGRQQALQQVDCDLMFRSNYFGVYDWTPGSVVVGYAMDTAFEMDCIGCPPPRGACCTANGECLLTYASACRGEFQGEWTDCDPDPCPEPPLGACCGGGGSCTLTTEPQCLSGDWRGGASCDPNPCPDVPPVGACLDYGDFPHWAGWVEVGDIPRDVAFTGTRGIVAEGVSGVHVLSLTHPGEPRILGSVDTPGWAIGVAIEGNRACVADSTSLKVVDLADSLHPRIVGSVSVWARAVAMAGRYAYVVGGQTMRVVDLDATGGPTVIGQAAASNYAFDVAVEGNFVYVAGNPGLYVIDVTVPAHPVLRGTVAAPSTARAIDVAGSVACLADMGSGLQVVDVSDPDHPRIVGEAETAMPAVNVAMANGHAHLTLARGDDAAFEIYDLADPAAPRKSNGTGVPGSRPWGAAACGSMVAYTYKNHYWEGGAVLFMDVATERCAPLLGKLNVPGLAFRDLAISGETGCVLTDAWAQGGMDFHVLDLAGAPSAITVLGGTNLGNGVQDVEVAGPYAYVYGWDEYNKLTVVDISDPQAPVTRGTVWFSGSNSSLAVSSGYVFATDAYGLIVVDVSDPDQPEIVAQLELYMEQILAIAIEGSYLYATGTHRFEVVDISSPENPAHAASLVLADYGRGIAVAGGYAYLHEYRSRAPDFVQVVDVTNPRMPVLRGTATVPQGQRMAAAGSFLYMCAGGLLVVDVADPDHPFVVGQAMRNPLSAVAAEDGMIFASSEDLLVLPEQCVAAGLDDCAGLSRAPSLRVSPNPVRGSAVLRCIVPEAGSIRASIYDLGGRRVRVLHDGAWSAGAHDLVWDGKDGRGRRVASGVYVARLAAGAGEKGGSSSARILVVR